MAAGIIIGALAVAGLVLWAIVHFFDGPETPWS